MGRDCNDTIDAMSKLLERAIDEARKLPEDAQETLAWVMLEEIDSERRWDELFSRPPSPALERMADEALEDYRAGRTEPLDPDKL
jgi:phage shock protein A